ncbi:MAG: methyltransferase [Gammaproteobacteria bacterium]|nr:methyltransferase [Gammaproteobacteria bacterium]
MDRSEYLAQVRRDIEFSDTLCGQPLKFRTTWGIFSPKAIDEGTRLLLSHLEVNPTDDCMDLGCGYGPIGITVARLAPQGRTLMVDKDYVAVEYAKKNIEINGLKNADARLSNAFSEVGEQQFDLIVSNIPAKVGKEMLAIINQDAFDHLRPGGRFYVVSVNGLRQLFKREFTEVFGNYKKVKQGKNYTVSMARKPS